MLQRKTCVIHSKNYVSTTTKFLEQETSLRPVTLTRHASFPHQPHSITFAHKIIMQLKFIIYHLTYAINIF